MMLFIVCFAITLAGERNALFPFFDRINTRIIPNPAAFPAACLTVKSTRATGIPRYKPDDETHRTLSALSEKCHAAASLGDAATIAALETEIDAAAALLWNITPEELAAIHESLAEMKITRHVPIPDDSDDALPELVLEV